MILYAREQAYVLPESDRHRPVTRERVAAHRHALTLSLYRDLAELAVEWADFEQRADATPFQSYLWLSTWQECIGRLKGVTPMLVAGRNGAGDLMFIMPLAIAPSRRWNELTWLGDETSDYNAPLLAKNFAAEVPPAAFVTLWRDVIELVREQSRIRVDLVRLTKMPPHVGAQPNPFLNLRTSAHPSSAYLTALLPRWEDYYELKRSSATRRRERTKRKRLADHGALQFVTAASPAQGRSTLDVLMRQKAKSFTRMGVGNIFARPGAAEFYLALAAAANPDGLIHVSSLDVGTEVVAANLGLVFQDCYFHVLTSHADGELGRLGPGLAHLHDLMRHAIARGCKRFDFTIGDERYKRDWCETEIVLHDHLSAQGLLGYPAVFGLDSMRSLKRYIKKTPALWNTVSRLRSLLGQARQRFLPDRRDPSP